MAAPPLLPASFPCLPAIEEGDQPAVPLARGVTHAPGGTMEPTPPDHTLAQAGVQDGL